MPEPAIVASALRWIGTPYRHQASVRGAGCDCLGLIRGVWRDVMGAELASPPPYTPDWAESEGAETLLTAAQTHLLPVLDRPVQPGDILAFRLRPDLPVKHLGIASGPAHFIHAYWRRGVCESACVPFWQRRHSHTFRFPHTIKHSIH